MKTKKKRRFRPIKKLSRGSGYRHIEKWIPESANDVELACEIKKLSRAEFEKVAKDILHYNVQVLYSVEIDTALTERVASCLESLRADILKIGNFSISSPEAAKIKTKLDLNFYEIENKISELWRNDIHMVWLNETCFRKSHSFIVEYSNLDPIRSRQLRREITYRFYQGVGQVKLLCKMRTKNHYDKFIHKYVLSVPIISDFLRYAKPRGQTLDIKDFERSMNRFMKNYGQ